MNAVKLNVSYSVTRDDDIWQELKSGNRDAIDRIYYAHVPALIAYGHQFTKDNALVDDCIQELIVDLWIKRSRLGNTSSIRFYLLKSLKRRILRSLKKEKKKTCFADLSELLSENIIHQPNEVNGATDEKDNKRLIELVDNLSPIQKEIILLKFFNNLSFDEIGIILDLSKKQLYNALSKAMNNLRKQMQVILIISLLSVL